MAGNFLILSFVRPVSVPDLAGEGQAGLAGHFSYRNGYTDWMIRLSRGYIRPSVGCPGR